MKTPTELSIGNVYSSTEAASVIGNISYCFPRSSEKVDMNNRLKDFARIKQKLRQHQSYADDKSCIYAGDSLELIRQIPSQSVSLILTDPPYHSTKKQNIKGDVDFDTDSDFLNWIKQYVLEWRRIIKPNGSLYCFCSSKMATRIELLSFSNPCYYSEMRRSFNNRRIYCVFSKEHF